MCSLNKKCHPLFELLQRTVLAYSQGHLSFEVYLPSFPLNTNKKLTVWSFWSFFASLSSKRRFEFSSDRKVGGVTSARINYCL